MMAADVTLWGLNLWFISVVWVTVLKEMPFCWSSSSFLHFSAGCQQFCCCLSSWAWQTSHSSLQWLHSCGRQLIKWICRPFLLKLNYIDIPSCWLMSEANITLSQLIPHEGELQLVSCTVYDVHLFSKVTCPSTYSTGFFLQPVWSCNILPITTVCVSS